MVGIPYNEEKEPPVHLNEGEHYIFDRYVFLGLTPDAAENDIHTAIRNKRAANHPDAFNQQTKDHQPDMLAKAEHNRILVDICAEILTNPARKAAYDERLAWFREHHPELISDDGREIQGSGLFFVAVDQLLSGEPPDHSFMERALSEADVKDRALNRLRRDYQECLQDPDAPPTEREATREDLLEALLKRLEVMRYREDYAWQKAGVYGMRQYAPKVPYIDDYKATIADRIAEVRKKDIPEAVATKAAGLISGLTPPLLLTDERHGGSGQEPGALARLEDVDIERITAQLQEAFEQRTHTLKMLSGQKQALLQEIFSLLSTDSVAEGKTSGKTEIVLLLPKENGPPVAALSMLFEDRALKEERVMRGSDDRTEALLGKTLDEMRALPLEHNTYAIEYHPELTEYTHAFLSYCYQKYKGEELGFPLEKTGRHTTPGTP